MRQLKAILVYGRLVVNTPCFCEMLVMRYVYLYSVSNFCLKATALL